MAALNFRSSFFIKGHVRIEFTRPNYVLNELGEVVEIETELLEVIDEDNLILDAGLEGIADVMAFPGSGRTFFAISVGDQGTLSSNPFIPKEIDPARVDLFHQLGSRAALNTGFTAVRTANEVQCQRLFQSSEFLSGHFADSSQQFLNEAMVFIGKPPPDDDPDADWVPFSMRTFKSVPFSAVDAVSANVKWTFSFERGTT